MALSQTKARKILKDGTVRGKKLTPKQKKLMGARAGGKLPMKLSDLPQSARSKVK